MTCSYFAFRKFKKLETKNNNGDINSHIQNKLLFFKVASLSPLFTISYEYTWVYFVTHRILGVAAEKKLNNINIGIAAWE